MKKQTLYNAAKCYIDVIARMEQTRDAEILAQLEEQRVMWHNEFIDLLKQEGFAYQDREHVTRMAYQIVRNFE